MSDIEIMISPGRYENPLLSYFASPITCKAGNNNSSCRKQ